VRSRLDDIIRASVPTRCAALLGQVLDDRDPAIWLIRNLNFEFLVDVGQLDDSAIAAHWGDRTAQAIARELALGPDGDNVIRFANEEAYLAAFLADVVRGHARGRWYFAALESLAQLPTGALVASVLAREDIDPLAIVSRLAVSGVAGAVLDALSDQQTSTVVDCLVRRVARDRHPLTFRALESLRHPPPGWRQEASLAKAALRLYFAIREWSDNDQEVPLPEPFLQAIVLSAVLLEARDGRERSLISLLSQGRMNEAARLISVSQPGLRIAGELMLQVSPPEAMSLATVAVHLTSETPEEAVGSSVIHSPFAAAFLLIPPMLELGIPQMETNPGLRLLVLLKCLGGSQTRFTRADPAVLLAAGASSLDHLDSLDPVEVRAALVASLQRQGRLENKWLAFEVVGDRAVIRDPIHGEWACIRPPASRERISGLPRTVRKPSNMDRKRSKALQRPVDADLAHLSLPKNEVDGMTRELDEAASLLASATLRGLARRLVGFEASSLTYLATNFLAAEGEIRDETAITVSLARMPLGMVLRMAGVSGRPFAVPWLDGRFVTTTVS
jgi:hypothetical protein